MSDHPTDLLAQDCRFWVPKEDYDAKCAQLATVEAERSSLTLKLRCYENGENINQPLVDDIGRFRCESQQAMKQRDAQLGTLNKVTRALESLQRRMGEIHAEVVDHLIDERDAAYRSPWERLRELSRPTTGDAT